MPPDYNRGDDPHDDFVIYCRAGEKPRRINMAGEEKPEEPFPWWTVGVGFLLVLAMLMLAQFAFAQPRCIQRSEMVAQLATRWNEAPRLEGLISGPDGSNPRGVMELWASASGTWSLILSMPDGLACLMAAGTGLQNALPVVLGSPA